MRRVLQLLGRSEGGIRRHVRYLADHPPPGWETVGVCGPEQVHEFFAGLPFANRADALGARPDLYHAHGVTAGVRALRARLRPLVVTLHVYDVAGGRRPAVRAAMRAAAPFVLRGADALVAVSDDAAQRYPTARVIPPAVQLRRQSGRSRSDVRAELDTPQDAVVVVTAARLHPDKALDVLVDAVAATDATAWIAGDGPLRTDLERRAAGTRVRLLGYRDDVMDLYAAADVYALSSVGDAYPVAVVEAISAGLPVVATRVGAVPQIAGAAGVLVEPGDRTGFAKALAGVVADDGRRRELAEAARARVLPGPDELCARLGAVYDGVCGS